MKGITFGNYHSYDDLHLILESKELGAPDVKVNKIDIPGADSALDLTDFFGVKYDDVKHTFQFTSIEPQETFLSQFSTIKNAIHGKKVRIILDDDPSFFYLGRCFVSSFTNDKGIGTVSVECECEPYKYKLEKTTVSKAVNGTATVNLTNSRKRAVPEITTNATMTIAFGGGTWTVNAGTFIIPELELFAGANNIAVTGTGNISFTWQEGDL